MGIEEALKIALQNEDKIHYLTSQIKDLREIRRNALREMRSNSKKIKELADEVCRIKREASGPSLNSSWVTQFVGACDRVTHLADDTHHGG